MKKLFIITVVVLLCNSCGSTVPLILKENFKNALLDDYDKSDLQAFHSAVDSLWSNMYWINNDIERLIKQTHVKHPYYLADFRHTRLYRKNISKLLHSNNPNQRLVAHTLIRYTKDKKYADTLLATINHENDIGVRYYNILGIGAICPKETDIVFEYIVKSIQLKPYRYDYYHNVRNACITMDTVSLIRTAYKEVHKNDVNAQVLSIYIISTLDTSQKPEAYIKNAINNWDDSLKAYAFSALAKHKGKDLKVHLQPYVQNPKLWIYVIQALKNSSSTEDIQFADSLILSNKK